MVLESLNVGQIEVVCWYGISQNLRSSLNIEYTKYEYLNHSMLYANMSKEFELIGGGKKE